MRIGIDVDDVVTETSKEVEKYVLKYDENDDMSNHLEEIMRGEMPTPKIKKFFAENITEIIKNVELKENAKEVLQRLEEKGDKIFLITSRGEKNFKDSEKITLEFLKNNNVKYTKILFNVYEKSKVCKENRIDIMVDDSVKHCEECVEENIKSIVFTSIVNKDINTDIERTENWIDLEKKIEKIRNKKD